MSALERFLFVDSLEMFGLGCVSEIYNHRLGATKANFKMGGPVFGLKLPAAPYRLSKPKVNCLEPSQNRLEKGQTAAQKSSVSCHLEGRTCICTCALNIGRTQREQRPSFLDLHV